MSAIANYQNEMARRGIYKGDIDGDFGPLTLAAAQIYELGPKAEVPVWMLYAGQELGVSEILGNRHNPQIIEYGKATSLRPSTDEIPWCSCFTNWCMMRADVERTNSAAAASWDSYGIKHRLYFGAVLTFPTNTGSRRHVTFCAGWNKTHIFGLGGNQSNRVKVSAFNRSDVTACRWPKSQLHVVR